MRMPDNRDSRKEQHSNGANGARARQKDLEAKRLRGEISCAECRRLKLKCDKKVPCSSCKRRGCETICPLGELLGGQGGRLVLAETDELHRTITDMSKRIRQLEDALKAAHDMRSTESHPLLRDELLSVKKGLVRVKSAAKEVNEPREDEQEDELLCAMGLLTISEGGGTRYLGTSGSEQALLAEVGVSGAILPDVAEGISVPDKLCQANQFWPFGDARGSTVELHILLEFQLPSRERASALSEGYLSNMYWFSRPVTREQIMEELIPAAYKPLPDSPGPTTRMDLHDLALLYMIFAVGAAADFTMTPYNAEAERYRRLARAALGLKSVFDGNSMSAVQAIFLMGTYDVSSGRKHSMESAWKLMCLAFSLGTNIGLRMCIISGDRDPARWHLDPKVIQRRRQLCWEMCVVDNWKSLSTGRPPSFTPEIIDCEFPEDQDAVVLKDGTIISSLTSMKYKFAKEVLSKLAVRLCAARQPKYSEILEMDHQVREFDMQPIKPDSDLWKDVNEHTVYIRHCALSMFRDRVLLHLHRNYFARSLLGYPGNPLRSPFYPSFLATYRSATSLLKSLRESFTAFPFVFLRHWPIWGHALAASIVIGSVITRSPTCCLAPAALNELEQAIQLFKSASSHPIVRPGVPILMGIYERVRAALEKAKKGGTPSEVVPENIQRMVNSFMGEVDEKSCEDILNVLMGTTRTEQQRNEPRPSYLPPQPETENSSQNYSLQNLSQATADNTEPTTAHLTGDTIFFGNGEEALGDPFSVLTLTGAVGGMPEGPSVIASLLGPDGTSVHVEKQPSQPSSSATWPSLSSASDSGDQMQGLLNLMLPGWRNYLPQDQTSSGGGVQQDQMTSEIIDASDASKKQPELFPFGGIDFSNSEQLVSDSPETSSTPQSFIQVPNGTPPADDTSFVFVEPGQFSEFAQASVPLSDVNFSSSLPPIDDPWQFFVSDSGFQPADELVRDWSIY